MSSIVLVISGSAREPSFTEKMLDLCIEGMGGNLEVHIFYPNKMKINPCSGCWSCWGKKRPGVCIQKDDFEQILDVYKCADYFLLATPLYFFDFPATVKNVIDRFFVVLKPAQIESKWGGTEHHKRFGRHPKAALISSCGYPEITNFEIGSALWFSIPWLIDKAVVRIFPNGTRTVRVLVFIGAIPFLLAGFYRLSFFSTKLLLQKERLATLNKMNNSAASDFLAGKVVFEDYAPGGFRSINRVNYRPGALRLRKAFTPIYPFCMSMMPTANVCFKRQT